jgi:hypothetical protein
LRVLDGAVAVFDGVPGVEPQSDFGEPLTGYDPEISEWDNPRRDYLPARSEFIATGSQPSLLRSELPRWGLLCGFLYEGYAADPTLATCERAKGSSGIDLNFFSFAFLKQGKKGGLSFAFYQALFYRLQEEEK